MIGEKGKGKGEEEIWKLGGGVGLGR